MRHSLAAADVHNAVHTKPNHSKPKQQVLCTGSSIIKLINSYV